MMDFKSFCSYLCPLSFPFALNGTSNKEISRLKLSKKLNLGAQMPSFPVLAECLNLLNCFD